MTRVALVHDWLDRPMNGAERVTLELADLFPDAPVYTLLFDPTFDHGGLDHNRISASRLQKLPRALRRRPRYLLPLIPGAVEAWDFRGFDVVISSSAAFVKNIVTPARTTHICYCHSPMRFAWDYWPRYLEEMHVGPIRRAAIRALVHRLRLWDLAGAARVDRFIANSKTTEARIAKYYNAYATLVYPPVAIDAPPPTGPRGDSYVTLSTLTKYKRVDLAIHACNAARRPLTVIGDGPDRPRLRALAGPTIRFVGHANDVERARLLGAARALIFPNEEDFGIAAVEALACGTPVVAYGRGGLTETVEDGRTGVFFTEQSVASVNSAIDRLQRIDIDRDRLRMAAQRFAPANFRSQIQGIVDAAAQPRAREGVCA
jgi:glycosyltransferase involved in cell wall biosynthesis